LRQSQIRGEAESEAVCPNSDLKTIIDAWPALPYVIKVGILAMVRTASGAK